AGVQADETLLIAAAVIAAFGVIWLSYAAIQKRRHALRSDMGRMPACGDFRDMMDCSLAASRPWSADHLDGQAASRGAYPGAPRAGRGRRLQSSLPGAPFSADSSVARRASLLSADAF